MADIVALDRIEWCMMGVTSDLSAPLLLQLLRFLQIFLMLLADALLLSLVQLLQTMTLGYPK